MSGSRILFLLLLLMVSLLIVAALPGDSGAAWNSETIHSTRSLSAGFPRGIAVENTTNLPHMVYGGEGLYHYYYDGAQWQNELVDSNTSGFAAIVVDQNNKVHISYYSGGLKYATNASGAWVIATVDIEGDSLPTSIAVDSNGMAHISYNIHVYTYDVIRDRWVYSGPKLQYATNSSGSWVLTEIDASNGTSCDGHNGIALDPAGNVHISYHDADGDELKYATNASGSWAVSTIDSVGDVGRFNSIEVDSSGSVHIGYHDSTGGMLKYATDSSGSWAVETIDTVGSYDFGGNVSIAAGSNDKVYIGYRVSAGVVRYASNSSGSWVTGDVDGNYFQGSGTPNISIAVDSDNKMHFSHFNDWQNDLKYATNASGSWNVEIIENTSQISAGTIAAATDSNNRVHISYLTDALMYATNSSGSWLTSTIDNTKTDREVREYSAIAVDSLDNIHIAYTTYYYNVAIGWTYVLKHATNSSGSWVISDVYQSTSEIKDISLALDSNDKSHISFNCQHLRYSTDESGAWVTVSADSASNSGRYSSIELDSNNKAHIAHFIDNDTLRYSTNASGSWVSSSIDYSYIQGEWASLILDPNDKVHIAYLSKVGDNTLYHMTNESGSWVKTAVSGGSIYTSLAMDSNGKLHIKNRTSYASDFYGSWESSDVGIDTGRDRSLAIDSLDTLHVGYSESGDLKYASYVPAAMPKADFTASTTSGLSPLTVNFTDASTYGNAPFSYEWDFESDGTVDSTAQNPSHTYTASGSYTVTLRVTDADGDIDAEVKQDHILVISDSAPVADFIGAPTKGCDSLQVQFSDTTTGGDGPLSYYWEFEGSSWVYPLQATSTEQNPVIDFEHYGGTAGGDYVTVRLTVTDADGDSNVMEKIDYIYVGNSWPGGPNPPPPCKVVSLGFTTDAVTGDAPFTVNFTNSSTSLEGPLTYEWDFDNDGTVDSTDENPSYTYNSVGTYSVKLTATDPYGRSSTGTWTDYILVKIGTVPAADFSGTPTSGSNPLTVNFTNATTGGEGPFSYEWDFDNNGTIDSTAENPSNTYTSSGTFSVTLTVTDVHGDTDTITKQDYIFLTTNLVPSADFSGAPTSGCDSVQVQFSDASTGGDGALTYFWEFIPGSFMGGALPWTSAEQNPSVVFEHYGGSYPDAYATVRLTVTDADGDTDVMEKTDYIYVKSSYVGGPYNGCSVVRADFTGTPTSGYAPLTVGFTNTSTSLESSLTYEWDFDNDGTVDSTEENPSYTYSTPGTYTVKLTATDPFGRSSTDTMTDYITVTAFTGDISAGHEHTLLVKPDGTLWAWGHNDEGQVGDGTLVDRHSPVRIGTDTDWIAVSAGWKHSVALKTNGTLWAWGDNAYAQLGDGTSTDRYSPVQIGTDTDWTDISAGGAHSLALKSGNTLWAWGLNSNGQIGDGTTATKYSPVQIGADIDWDTISAGWEHSAAIKTDGALYTWGWNSDGQVGDGTTTSRYSPARLGSDLWLDVSAGWKHTVALKDDNMLYAWGDNEYGQVGDGTTIDRLSPVLIGTGISSPSLIDAGGAHTIVRTSNNELWGWGLNSTGQIGDGTTATRLTPVLMGTADWILVSAGWEHTASFKSDGSFWIWGWNAYGQLGNGTTTDSHTAITLSVPSADFTGSPLSGEAPLTVSFSDLSGGLDRPFSCEWDFDNDGTSDSTEAGPSHIYTEPGTYTVRLSVVDSDSDSDSLTRTNYITACYAPVIISGSPVKYTSLQAAYNATDDGDTIKSKVTDISENIFINQNTSVVIEAGYDCVHTSQPGSTSINGTMWVTNGTFTISSGTLQLQ